MQSLIEYLNRAPGIVPLAGFVLILLILFVLWLRTFGREDDETTRGSRPESAPRPQSDAEFEQKLEHLDRIEPQREIARKRGPEIAHAERRPAPVPAPIPAPMPAPATAPGKPTAATPGVEKSDHFVVTVHFGTDRKDEGPAKPIKERFSDNRARPPRGASHITYGTCEVAIPKIHKIGELEAPGWFSSEQPGEHVMLLSLKTAERAAFLANLKKAMSDDRSVFVFVHGFSVSFEDAARRTAQMAFDMKFRGAPIFFDWPTSGLGVTNVNAYPESENNSRWATEHFRVFLLDVVRETGAKTVHLIAHSMGNRIVTDALMELYWVLSPKEKEIIGEVILTAPDIDADVFVDQIAPRITAMNSRVTLYTSANDKALKTSQGVHGYARAGDFAALTVMPAKVEVVDASEVDTDSFGHSYYGNAHSVISDICHLITGRASAGQRTVTLASLTSTAGEPFWRVKKESTLEQVWAAMTGKGGNRVA